MDSWRNARFLESVQGDEAMRICFYPMSKTERFATVRTPRRVCYSSLLNFLFFLFFCFEDFIGKISTLAIQSDKLHESVDVHSAERFVVR